LEAAEAEVARLKEFMACADTPLMRDVLAERDRLRANALLAGSLLDWCIGYFSGYDQHTNEHLVREKLIEARAALGEDA
jgi:hypothetical protein